MHATEFGSGRTSTTIAISNFCHSLRSGLHVGAAVIWAQPSDSSGHHGSRLVASPASHQSQLEKLVRSATTCQSREAAAGHYCLHARCGLRHSRTSSEFSHPERAFFTSYPGGSWTAGMHARIYSFSDHAAERQTTRVQRVVRFIGYESNATENHSTNP